MDAVAAEVEGGDGTHARLADGNCRRMKYTKNVWFFF
jgi:hypothetical protein